MPQAEQTPRRRSSFGQNGRCSAYNFRARPDVEHTGKGFTSGREGIMRVHARGNEERPMAEIVQTTARGCQAKIGHPGASQRGLAGPWRTYATS